MDVLLRVEGVMSERLDREEGKISESKTTKEQQ